MPMAKRSRSAMLKLVGQTRTSDAHVARPDELHRDSDQADAGATTSPTAHGHPHAFRVEDITQPDERAKILESLAVVDSSFVDAVRAVFAGTDFLHQEQKVRKLVQVHAEVLEHWVGVRDRYLGIGRALLELDDGLSKLEGDRLRGGMARLFPFGATVASQLKQVARAVKGGKLSPETCPGSYSAAYQLVQMTDGELEHARREGLVRPDVSRDILIDFRRRMSGSARAVLNSALHAERRKLLQRRNGLRHELQRVDSEIAELEKRIAADKPAKD